MKKKGDYLLKIFDIGISLTTEKDPNKLLEMILKESREITHADAGTLYIRKNDKLHFKIIQNQTLNIFQGENGESIDLPPLNIEGDSVSAYVARTKKTLNISNIYEESDSYLEGPKKYDKMTGYKTESMLVIPLIDREYVVIGVMLLINAKTPEGKIVPFLKYYERVIAYYASQVAMYISNMNYLEEIHALFNSFVEVMVKAIDKRTRYNANHTKNIVVFLQKFLPYINNITHGELASQYFNRDRTEEIVMAAWLHDIGKLAIPLNIMDKPTRLAEKYEVVIKRIHLEKLQVKIYMLEGKINNEEYRSRTDFLDEVEKIIEICNSPNKYIDDELLKKLENLYKYEPIGDEKRLLLDDEYEYIIVRRGTLTDKERKIMQDHVIFTKEMLNRIPFTEKLKHVNMWASMHHEFLDGSGYPEGVDIKSIPFEVRILTMLDIFEALVSADRPYKKPMERKEAIGVLKSMAKDGKLDKTLVLEFEKSEVWMLEVGDQKSDVGSYEGRGEL
ncbi:MAG: hypothetical protein A2Y24_02675 [Clostridiales bacterium GWE2_32_10]|nr:MAG: hypothetical protein A2Y24_02675 [Clostridiales bacterium GWE2_32_10]HBY20119.1 phosphohydrolase [Clostridiales bacterium]